MPPSSPPPSPHLSFVSPSTSLGFVVSSGYPLLFCGGAAMEGGLMPEGVFVSPSLLALMAEAELLSLPPLGQCHHLECYCGEGDGRQLLQVGCPPVLLTPEHLQETSDHMTLKVPKLEQTTTSDLPFVAMEAPSDLGCITRMPLPPGSHRLPLPLSFASHVAAPLPPPSYFVGQRSIPRSTARPPPQQLIPPNTRGRSRRRGISERIRMLAKLMPWDRKMTIGVMLEEARKYVKFLEAQVAALQCMPAESRFACPPPSSYAASAPVLRGLERLTRQQLLHVLVRSPLVQDKLCARGLCVFATEQVILMRQQAAEREKILHRHLQQQQRERQMVLDNGSTTTVSD